MNRSSGDAHGMTALQTCDHFQMSATGKLIRDRIPEIVAAKGGALQTRILEPSERLDALFAKLAEESDELREAGNLDHQVEELGDVLEVLRGIANHLGVEWHQVEEIADAKQQERGGFDLGVWMRF